MNIYVYYYCYPKFAVIMNTIKNNALTNVSTVEPSRDLSLKNFFNTYPTLPEPIMPPISNMVENMPASLLEYLSS